LGEVTARGVVENLQHIGATSVPGLPASPCLDIGLSVWPFPLEAHRQDALEALGYTPVPGYEGAPEQRFRHNAYQLYIVEAGSDLWTNYLLIRDYLRHDEAARQAYVTHKPVCVASTIPQPAEDKAAAKTELFRPLLAAAQDWWVNYHGFSPVENVARELQGFPHAWYVSSGWALDLFLGRVTRVHHDVDIVVARTDQLALQQYMTERGWRFVTPFEGRLEPWPSRMILHLPRHQVHAHREGAFIDFLLTDIAQGVWQFRRDPAILRRTERMALSTGEGILFLAPELVLLFKSKNTSGKERGKDQEDFEKVHTKLEPERRVWLRWALTATDPAHPWIEQLF
ncbi:MAG: GrpB family protein, partial [Ardenticatenaceae bacterium]